MKKVIKDESLAETDNALEDAAVRWNPKNGLQVSELINRDIRDAFIAGAEWQREQDQPITGNSLEQEWLRYVDKKKKECRGELPSLGEYGWLLIARHFAEWQKKQMMKEAVEAKIYGYDDGSFELIASWLDMPNNSIYKDGDKVKIIIVKKKEEEI